MQLTNTPGESQFLAIEKFLQPERLARYSQAATGSNVTSFQLYIWNCQLCEAFYIPLHFAEVGCRNAMNAALVASCGPTWYSNQGFINLLNPRFEVELADAVKDEAAQHGAGMTGNHVVSALTFGFWEHLTTRRFNRMLWSKGIHPFFPGAPAAATYEDLQKLIESCRRWRNRIAHHRAIFDKSPSYKLQQSYELIKWICSPTLAWVLAQSQVQKVINQRPK